MASNIMKSAVEVAENEDVFAEEPKKVSTHRETTARTQSAEAAPSEEFDDSAFGKLVIIPGLRVFRETVTSKSNKKQYTNFYIKTIVRGRTYKAYMVMPKTDQFEGAYDFVNLLFEGEESLALAVEPYAMKNDKGKVESRGLRYYAVVKDDELDTVYKMQFNPKGAADKGALLANLMCINQREQLGLTF